jgi:hypothetical protein
MNASEGRYFTGTGYPLLDIRWLFAFSCLEHRLYTQRHRVEAGTLLNYDKAT